MFYLYFQYVIPEISPFILQKTFAKKIIETLEGNGVSYKNEPPPIGLENAIGWIRKLPKYSVDENAKVILLNDLF